MTDEQDGQVAVGPEDTLDRLDDIAEPLTPEEQARLITSGAMCPADGCEWELLDPDRVPEEIGRKLTEEGRLDSEGRRFVRFPNEEVRRKARAMPD